jgi:hypothetical protein
MDIFSVRLSRPVGDALIPTKQFSGTLIAEARYATPMAPTKQAINAHGTRSRRRTPRGASILPPPRLARRDLRPVVVLHPASVRLLAGIHQPEITIQNLLSLDVIRSFSATASTSVCSRRLPPMVAPRMGGHRLLIMGIQSQQKKSNEKP